MNELQKEWYRQRVAAIHARVTAYDVLRSHGVDLSQAADDREEQFSCPFHGEDKKPSARVYPEREDNPSHVWCYVCQEPGWDAIGLWKKFNNQTFGQSLSALERTHGMPTPEAPKGAWASPSERAKESARERYKALYTACESRLLACKATFQRLDDMRGYLNAGSVLDRVKYKVDNNVWDPEKGEQVLTALLERIREKTRACPAG